MAANDGERKAARPSASSAFRLELPVVSSAVVGLGLSLARCRASPAQSAAGRGAGEFVFVDEAPDCSRHCGEFGVGEVDGRHGSLPRLGGSLAHGPASVVDADRARLGAARGSNSSVSLASPCSSISHSTIIASAVAARPAHDHERRLAHVGQDHRHRETSASRSEMP
jgi:hypothetical protein